MFPCSAAAILCRTDNGILPIANFRKITLRGRENNISIRPHDVTANFPL